MIAVFNRTGNEIDRFAEEVPHVGVSLPGGVPNPILTTPTNLGRIHRFWGASIPIKLFSIERSDLLDLFDKDRFSTGTALDRKVMLEVRSFRDRSRPGKLMISWEQYRLREFARPKRVGPAQQEHDDTAEKHIYIVRQKDLLPPGNEIICGPDSFYATMGLADDDTFRLYVLENLRGLENREKETHEYQPKSNIISSFVNPIANSIQAVFNPTVRSEGRAERNRILRLPDCLEPHSHLLGTRIP